MKQPRSKSSGKFVPLNNEELWQTYSDEYSNQEARGGGMNQTKFTKSEFMGELVMARNEGQKVNAEYVRSVAKAQKYKLTTVQAYALQPALKIASKDIAERALLENAKLSKDDPARLSKQEEAYFKKVIEKGGTNYSIYQIQSGFGRAGAALKEIRETYHELRTGDMGLNPDAASSLLKQKYQFRSPKSP